MVRAALERFLRASGFGAAGFGSGEEFLRWSESHQADCGIVDVDLPGVNGLQMIERLAAGQRSMPCIVITGSERAGVRERAIAAGAVAFIRKPVEGDELLSALSGAVSACHG